MSQLRLIIVLWIAAFMITSGYTSYALAETREGPVKVDKEGQLNKMDITFTNGTHTHDFVLLENSTASTFPTMYFLEFSESIDLNDIEPIVGHQVRIEGKTISGDEPNPTITVDSIVSLEPKDRIGRQIYQQGYPPSVIKQVIVPSKYSGFFSEPHTPSFYDSQYYSGSFSVKGYWSSASYGKTTLTGQVLNWQTLSQSSYSSEYFLALNAVQKADPFIDFNGNDNVIQNRSPNLGGPGDNGDDIDSIVIIVNNKLPTSWAAGIGFYSPLQFSTNEGLVYVSVNLIADMPLQGFVGLACHEMGHNFGWVHTPTAECVYCDPWSIMSASDFVPGVVAFNKFEAGWIASNDVITVTQSSTITLDYTHNSSPDPNKYLMAKIPYGSAGQYYVLEAREPSTYDLTPSGQTGLLIYLFKPGGHPNNPESFAPLSIVNTDGNWNWADADLDLGSTFIDRTNNVYISNIAQSSEGITVGVSNSPPVANAGPDQFVNEQDKVLLDGSGSQSQSENPLSYSWRVTSGPAVTIVDSDKSAASFVAPLVNLNQQIILSLTVSDGIISVSDEVSVNVNNNILGNQGGPDSSGYKFIDSFKEDGPEFEWIDITYNKGATNVLKHSDDSLVSNVPIGFNFNFYDTKYSHLNIYSNGGVSFGSNGEYLAASNSPSMANDATNFIAPFWDDLYNYQWGVYYATIGDAPERKFVVTWSNVLGCCYSSDYGSFQVILEEQTNDILFQYLDVDFGNSQINNGVAATIGIKGSGSYSMLYSHDSPMIVPDMAVEFSSDSAATEENLISIQETGTAQLAKSSGSFAKGSHSLSIDLTANYDLTPDDIPRIYEEISSGSLTIDGQKYNIQLQEINISADRKEITFEAKVMVPSGSVSGKLLLDRSLNVKKDGTIQSFAAKTNALNVKIEGTTFNVNAPSGGVSILSTFPQSANVQPIANAGPDQTVEMSQTVTLDGSDSSDQDNEDLTYLWTQTAGPDVILSSTTLQNPTFLAPTVSEQVTLTFALVVNDGSDSSDPDYVDILVQPGTSTSFTLTQDGTAKLAKKIGEFLKGSYPVSVKITGKYEIDGNKIIIDVESLEGTITIGTHHHSLDITKFTLAKNKKSITYSANIIEMSGTVKGTLKFAKVIDFAGQTDQNSSKGNSLSSTMSKIKFDTKSNSRGMIDFD